MSKLRDFMKGYAWRIQAAERVYLRRWLREMHPEELPDHMGTDWNIDELVFEVNRLGGDGEFLVEEARADTISKIVEGR